MKDILKSEIYIMLMNKTKSEINEYRKLLDCDVKSNLNKSDMAAGVAQYIEEEAEYWLRRFPTWELELVAKLVEMKPGEKLEAGFQPMEPILERLELLNSEAYMNTLHTSYWLTPTMHRAIKAGIKTALAYVMVKDYPLLDQYVMGVLNTYGLIPKPVLDSYVFNTSKAIQQDLGIEPDGLPGYFYAEESLLVNYNKLMSREGLEFVYHPLIEGNVEFMNIILSCPENIKYKKFKLEDFMDAGIGCPFITTALETLQGDRLMRILEKFSKTAQCAAFLFCDVYCMLQIDDQDRLTLLDLGFKEAPHISMEDYEEFKDALQAYKEVMPRWDLRGNSLAEIQGPRKNTKESDSFNPLDYVSKKVEPNKPCPCGSGKKYKDCHGRLS